MAATRCRTVAERSDPAADRTGSAVSTVDNLHFALDSGRATVVRDLEWMDEHRVTFADGAGGAGRRRDLCTGYRSGPSLLPPTPAHGSGGAEATPPQTARDRYKLTIPWFAVATRSYI